ncbi:MAG: TonB family protein [Woeseiaceae bacterium]|nr:TonB family protein [Woeseiaceae bacterium]
MSATSTEGGLDNVLILALIASVSLHLVALYSRVDWSATISTSEVTADGAPSTLNIPIEFVSLGSQTFIQNTVPGETVRSIVEEAEHGSDASEPVSNKAGHYSFIRRQTLLKRYLVAVREEIEKHKYVLVKNPSSLVGNVTVRFRILADGSFRDVTLLSSSGTLTLDRAAVVAVETASGKAKRSKVTGSRPITTTAVIKYQFGL